MLNARDPSSVLGSVNWRKQPANLPASLGLNTGGKDEARSDLAHTWGKWTVRGKDKEWTSWDISSPQINLVHLSKQARPFHKKMQKSI